MLCHGVMKVLGGLEFMKTLGGLPPMIPESETLRIALGIVATLLELLGGLGVLLGYRFKLACWMIVAVMIPAFASHLNSIQDFRSLMLNAWALEIAIAFAAFSFIGPGDRFRLGNR